MIIQLTYGESIEIGWAGAKHDQLILRTYTDDPELIRALEKFQAEATTPDTI